MRPERSVGRYFPCFGFCSVQWRALRKQSGLRSRARTTCPPCLRKQFQTTPGRPLTHGPPCLRRSVANERWLSIWARAPPRNWLRFFASFTHRKSSYFAVRAALHRRIQELKRPFNLFKTAVFTESHRVFDATLKMKKIDGLEPAVVHKEAITQEDRARPAEYFEDVLRANDPIKLSMYTWYWITLHFGLRAREVQVQLRKTDLVFNEGKDGVFITLATDFSSKNCQGGASGRDFNTVGRIDNPQQVAAIRFACCWKNCILQLTVSSSVPELDEFRPTKRHGSLVKFLDTIFWAKWWNVSRTTPACRQGTRTAVFEPHASAC